MMKSKENLQAASLSSPLTQPRHDMHNQWPRAESVDDFRENLAAVKLRIEAACQRSGRSADEVRLLPVSKTMDAAHIRLACAAGCTELGENKVQEAWGKAQSLADISGLRWSVIGHLQSNKAKLVAKFASEFQALDSLHVAEVLDRRLHTESRALDVFVQVNTSCEPSKYGLPAEDVDAFMRQIKTYENLRVRGLMTLAEFTSDAGRVRACFKRLRQLRDELSESHGAMALSMGMSGDFEIAIEEGATVVRVGQAIFGARLRPDGFYWPG